MRRPRYSSVLALAGLVAMAASWGWIVASPGDGHWTEQQAVTLQEAEATLHRLAGHGSELERRDAGAAQPLSPEEHAKSAEYQRARAVQQRLRGQLSAAQGNGRLLQTALFCTGLALLIAAGVAQFQGSPQPAK